MEATKPDYGKIVTIVLFGGAALAAGYFVLSNLNTTEPKERSRKKKK